MFAGISSVMRIVTMTSIATGVVVSSVRAAWLRARPAVLRWLFRSSGAILVALSVRLVLEGPHQ